MYILNILIYLSILTHSFSNECSEAMASGTCVSKLLLSSLKYHYVEITGRKSEQSLEIISCTERTLKEYWG